uniref:Uncharacterized protein n=1 Tax=viral metagenome TaxID=1070528 RepID=A0A6M3KPN1_9ZZZZ
MKEKSVREILLNFEKNIAIASEDGLDKFYPQKIDRAYDQALAQIKELMPSEEDLFLMCRLCRDGKNRNILSLDIEHAEKLSQAIHRLIEGRLK